MRRAITRWIFWLLPLCAAHCWAQVQTTQIEDTIYRADGSDAAGDLTISWPAFSENGLAVPAGRLAVIIGIDGQVSFPLAANSNAQPTGTYYTVLYHLSDGTVSTEYWTVPAAARTGIAAIRSQVMPATIAVQSASESYVNQAIADAVSGFLPLSGGTLSGPLYLSEDPLGSTEAATKHYVDISTNSITAGIGTRISTTPSATQTILQPQATTLLVNDLENVEYAGEYQTGTGANGINNAENAAACLTGGCIVTADPGYPTTEDPQGLLYPSCPPYHGVDSYQDSFCGFTWPLNSRFWDQRGGTDFFAYSNPRRTDIVSAYGNDDTRSGGGNLGLARAYIYDYDQGQGNAQLVPEVHVENDYAGGHNVNAKAISGTALSGAGKTNTIGTLFETHNFTQGQHFVAQFNEYCQGLGDCMVNPWQVYTSSGLSRPSDEGNHWGDKIMKEDPHVLHGTCSAGCTPDSTLLTIIPQNGSLGNAGEGRFLIDTTQASAGGEAGAAIVSGTGNGNHITNTSIINATYAVQAFTSPAGTYAVSNANTTLTADVQAPTGSENVGSATLQVADSTGFSTANGVICIADFDSFEMAQLTAVASGTLTATLQRPHPSGAYIFQGGTCGQFLALNADYTLPNTGYSISDTIRRVFPLLGSPDSSTAYYWAYDPAFSNYEAGSTASGSGARYNTASGAAATYSSSTGLVTVTGCCGFAMGLHGDPEGVSVNFGNVTGQQLAIAGAADPNYNGTFAINVINGNTFSYSPVTPPSSSSASGLTISYCNCAFTLFPGAEVIGVYDQTARQVDGQLTLSANNVSWASGDVLEEPHWHEMDLENSHNFISFYQPMEKPWGFDGPSYGGHATGDLRGWNIYNTSPMNSYLGFGGTLTAPSEALDLEGWWNTSMHMHQAPNESVLMVDCKPTFNGVDGCTRWDAPYYMFENRGNDTGSSFGYLAWTPQMTATTGNNYTFSTLAGAAVLIGDNVSGASGGLNVTGGSLFANSATITNLTVANCSGCGSGSGGTTGSGATVLAGSPAISSPTVSGTTNLNGQVNINTGTGAGPTTIGSSGNGTVINGFLTVNATAAATFTTGISVSGNADYSGDAYFAPVASASSANPYSSSNHMYWQGSFFDGSSACTAGPELFLNATGASTGILSWGGAPSCNGTPLLFGMDMTGMFSSVTVPHLLTGGVSPALRAGTGVSAVWTTGTTHTDGDGSITLTAGATALPAGTTLASVAFGTAWNAAPNCVFSPGSAGAAAAMAYLPAAAVSGFTVSSGAAVPAGASLVFTYVCQQ